MQPQTTFANGINIFYQKPRIIQSTETKIGRPHQLRLKLPQVSEMRKMRSDGTRYKEIAYKYHVSIYTARDAVRGVGAYKGML